MAREIETVYDTTSKDRVRYVRHRLNGDSWTDVISTGYRHVKYDTAMDKLDRLRCLSRATISSCAGSEPWESKFLESFDYDSSGDRTNRRSGAFNTADDDAYTYVSGPTDIIDRVRGRDCRRWVLGFDDIDLHIDYEVPCT